MYCLKVRDGYLISGSRDKSIRIWRLPWFDPRFHSEDYTSGSMGSGDRGSNGMRERDDRPGLIYILEEAHDRSVLSLDFELDLISIDSDSEYLHTAKKGKRKLGLVVTGSSAGDVKVWEFLRVSSTDKGEDEGEWKAQGDVCLEEITVLRGHEGAVLGVVLRKDNIFTW